jgi:hypothetical protein
LKKTGTVSISNRRHTLDEIGARTALIDTSSTGSKKYSILGVQ